MDFYCIQFNDMGERCYSQCEHCKCYAKRSNTIKKKVSKKSTHSTVQLSYRMDRDVYDKISKIAELDHRTVNNVIDTMVRNQLGLIKYDFDASIDALNPHVSIVYIDKKEFEEKGIQIKLTDHGTSTSK